MSDRKKFNELWSINTSDYIATVFLP